MREKEIGEIDRSIDRSKIVVPELKHQSDLKKQIANHISAAPTFLNVKANPWLYSDGLGRLESLIKSS